MGYYTHFSGSIEINPPLGWKDIRDWGDLQRRKYENPIINLFGQHDLVLEVEEYQIDTDTGINIVREGIAIVPASEDSYKGYDVFNLVSKLVETFPDRIYSGHIFAEGEWNGDIWRVRIKDGKAVKEEAKFSWPE